MVFTAKVITIFLSSPGDVSKDRNRVTSIVNAWNQRHGVARRLIFLALTWEDLVAPDIGTSGQDVINEQIGDSYDIFLGLMWSRFGTPTTDANSGTEEEFQRAVARHNQGKKVSIAFIFNSSPIPQEQLDIDQFSKVRSFKTSVASSGCLYREYSDDASLINSVNLILDKFANNLPATLDSDNSLKITKDLKNVVDTPEGGVNSSKGPTDDEDFGLFDLNEILETEVSRFVDLMGQWTKKIETAGKAAKDAAEKLNTISRFGAPDASEAKKIIDGVANVINETVDWGENALIDIDDCMSRFSEAQSGIVNVSVDFNPSDEELDQAINAGDQLLESVQGANNSLRDLAESALGTPRVSKYLNKANRRLASLLDAMVIKNSTFAKNVELNIAELKARHSKS